MIGSVRGGLGSVRTAQNVDSQVPGGGGAWPGFGVTAPPAVAGASSTGSSGLAAQSDHTHAGVTSVNGVQGAVTVTAFPGFGLAPPAIAGAGAAGVAATASRSDHTHRLDLVAYPPSLAGMQAGGVIQQTYAAPTATPAVLTMVAGQVPFGAAAGGTLTQSAALTWTDAAAGRFLTMTIDGASSAAIVHPLRIVVNPAPASNWRGGVSWTFGAVEAWSSHLHWLNAGATMIRRERFNAVSNPAVTDVTWSVSRDNAPPGVVGAGSSPILVDLATGNVGVGATSALPVGSTGGYFLIPRTAAAPSAANIPANFGAVANRDPILSDFGNRRLYGSFGNSGVWHWATLFDYDPTATRIPFGGATAMSLTDNANFTYSGFNIQLASTSAQQELVQTGNQSLFVGTGSGNTTGTLYLGTAHTVRASIDPAGILTVQGSGAAAPGGTYGNMVWTPANSRLTLGAPGGPPSVGSLYINTSTGSGISIGGGLTAGIFVADAGGGGEASIWAQDNLYAQRLVGQQSNDISMEVRSGNVLHLAYNAGAGGGGTDAIAIDGTTGAISTLKDFSHTVGSFSVAAGSFARMDAGAARLLINTNIALQYTGSGGGDALTVANADGAMVVNTGFRFNSVPEVTQTQAAGAQALTIGNGPTATGGGAADLYIKVQSGGNTYVVPAWQI